MERLRVVMVEDSATDAALLLRSLRNAGLEPEVQRVDTETALREALQAAPDVVFSDFQMPQFDGLSALRVVKELCPHVPFIIVSGQIGEDTAVEAMKRGAADYLLKDRLNRLGPAVRNALEQARLQRERQTAEAERHAFEERLQLFIEHAPAALAMFDRDMRYITTSRRWRDDFGLGGRPLVGVCHYEIFPEIGEAWKTIHRRALAGETLRADEDRFVRADGQMQWLAWEVRPWFEERGEVGGIVIFSEDITKRKEAELALARSEQQARQLYTTMLQGVVYQDATGRITAMNPAAVRILGRTPEDFLGESSVSVEDTTLREDGSPFPGIEHPSMVALRTGREVRDVVMGIYNPREGQRRWIRINAVPLFAEGRDRPEAAYTIFEDVTERKRADEQLRYHESILRETGRIAQVGGWSFDVATGGGFWTEEVARIHDLEPGDPTTREIGLQFYKPESRARLDRALQAAVEEGLSYDLELELVTAKGAAKWVRTIGHPQFAGARVVRLFGSFQDITARKRADFAVEIQRQVLELIALGAPPATTLRRLLELVEAQAPDCIGAIMVVDPVDGCLRTGASVSLPEEYSRAVDGVLLGPEEGSCGTAAYRGEPVFVDDIAANPLWAKYRDIAARHGLCACWSFPIVAEQHQILGTFAAYSRRPGPMPAPLRQLVEASTHTAAIALARGRDESARRESELRFRELAETINEVFWITDPGKRQMLYVSPAYERIWGRSCESLYAAPGKWIETVHEADRGRIAAALVEKQPAGTYNETYRIVRPGGEVRWISDRAFAVRDGTGAVVRMVGVAEDITEKKQIELQSLRAQRLEAIGSLAGGVAHDLNNILTPVLMGAAVLKSEAGGRDQELLNMIERSARRGADVIRQLLAFSRGVEGERAIVQPRHLIREMAGIIRETFPREIELHVDVANDLWPVVADSTQLHQVLLNLCVNARDAMPAGGRLSIEACNRQVDADHLGVAGELKPGPYVAMAVSDTGQGMAPEVVARIFEPFFTTKPQGKGTGLGLSTVLGIVRSHGGHVSVYSEPGLGSRFRVYLPAQVVSEPRPEKPPEPADRGHGELVLVVDDETAIREAVRLTLKRHGYRPLVAGNGEEAISLALHHSGGLRAVVTDVMMPVMDGIALSRSLRALDALLPIVAMSGLAQEEKRNELHSLGVREILSKPCSAEELLSALRRALDVPAAVETGDNC